MAHLELSKEITALLVIDPYNEFISASPPSIDNRTARIRTEKGRRTCTGATICEARDLLLDDRRRGDRSAGVCGRVAVRRGGAVHGDRAGATVLVPTSRR